MSNIKTMSFTYRNVFQCLEAVSNVAALSPDDRVLYDNDLKRTRDLRAEMTQAHLDGFEEGIRKGSDETRMQIARNMKEQGLDITLISSATGLIHDSIAAL